MSEEMKFSVAFELYERGAEIKSVETGIIYHKDGEVRLDGQDVDDVSVWFMPREIRGNWVLNRLPDKTGTLKAPPIGVMPKYIWLDQRFDELGAAIIRYIEQGFNPLPEWTAEREEIIQILRRDEAKLK